ncbi:hypothetical protein Hamer_G014260 [Homarus americanus]|uniref:Protein PET100 homolog, mitochondrial n=1 Tax=Homarus americanus TaxID=6706 RepID=A0A8J5JXY7_HOMAM|nr:hypothetical protein Hamer_G014260 [Homarus americanus]
MFIVIKMGGWMLEVGKMAMYMSFPVTLFYLFNQPKYFEDWTVRMRRELYPPLDKMHNEEIESCIKKMHERKERELLQALEEEETKN